MTKARNLSLLSAVEAGATADQTKADIDSLGISGLSKVLNVTTYVNSTRQVLSATTSITMASFTVNKLSSSSKLFIHGTMSGRAEHAGDLQQGWKLGSGTEFNGQTCSYQNNGLGRVLSTSAAIVGHTTTGSQTMVFRYFSVNNGNNKPFAVYNPHASDDARLAQTSSVFSVTEVEV